GVFGPRSREMIAAWQKKLGMPGTGFLTVAQRDQLLRAAAPAVARWDDEQKKIDEHKKAEEEKKKSDAQSAIALNQAGSGASATSASGSSGPSVAGTETSRTAALRDGIYRGGLGIHARALSLELRMSNGNGTGTATSSTCGTGPISLTVDPAGSVTGEMRVATSPNVCEWGPARITGRADGGKLQLVVIGSHSTYQSR